MPRDNSMTLTELALEFCKAAEASFRQDGVIIRCNVDNTFTPAFELGACDKSRIGSRQSGWECIHFDGAYGWTLIPSELRR